MLKRLGFVTISHTNAPFVAETNIATNRSVAPKFANPKIMITTTLN